MDSNKKLQPFVYALLLVAGISLGKVFFSGSERVSFLSTSGHNPSDKFKQTIDYLKEAYVDTINEKQLVEESINTMLQKLDPHSFYIPAEELKSVNESLEGNFEGIGVEFNIFEDTIVVVSPISGGPSELLGIKSGDRIVTIDGKNAAGIGITNKDVIGKLRGPSGTKVNVGIARRNTKALLPFTIVRGKIPIYSVDAGYMIEPGTGYIKINRFSETTYDEYREAFQRLKGQGLERLILDLRNNPGGYLQAATQISDEYLAKGKLIVFTKGVNKSKKEYDATNEGDFENGEMVVLIDEGSASASEIVSGALQDWDRAIIIGRRSFGKGLVQDQTMLPDSSALRITIARYYTPSGRFIQKPYSSDTEKYKHEVEDRIGQGELEHQDSIKFADSLKFSTLVKGRVVYGGGGIMPDIFVPYDTTINSPFLSVAISNGLLNKFVFDYLDKNRKLGAQYKSSAQFRKQYQISDELYNGLKSYVRTETKVKDIPDTKASAKYLKNLMKALIARSFWQSEGYYSVLNDEDETVTKALETLHKSSE